MMKKLRGILENQKLAIRICLALMLAGGIMMSIMIPPWQTPDEYVHLQMIGESLKNKSMADYLLQDMELDQDRIRFQYDEKIEIQLWKDAMIKVPDYTRKDCMPKGISLSVIKHLPAAAGILLGILLHLPTIWVLELGELFALLFYIGICGLALKLMPVKKEILLVIMAFPMSLQQAASLNYDSVLLPLSFLFTAYIFYMRHEKKQLGWKEAAYTLLLLFLVVYIKLPYVFLGLLVFLLPKEKIHLKMPGFEINGIWLRKWRIPLGIPMVLVIMAGIYVLRGNLYIQLVGGMVLEWRRTMYLAKETARVWGEYLFVSCIGQFGWLEAAVPFFFVVFSYVLMLVLAVWGEAGEVPHRLKKRTRCWLWIVFGVLFVFIGMSMVNHTIMISLFGSEHAEGTYRVREALYQIPYIGGLQGRYYLPFLALPFIALPEIKCRVKGKTWVAALYIMIGIIVSAGVLYRRYWG